MKKPLFIYMALAAAAISAWNCSDEDNGSSSSQTSVTVCGPSWVLNAGKTYVIYPDYVVTDENGVTVASFPYPAGQMVANIIDLEGNILMENVDLTTLDFHSEANSPIYKVKAPAWLLQDKSGDYIIYNDGTVYDSANTLVALTDMSTVPVVTLYSTVTQTAITSADLTTLRVIQPGDKCTEDISEKPAPVTSSSSQGGTTPAVSSSSQARSSSSAVRSSSSQQSAASLLPKVVSGGKSGSGYATRYWDSCKPHCAWKDKGGPIARTCNTDGSSRAGAEASSVCDGGNAGTCFDQTPQIVNDTIAYAFAATPGGGNDCGKCYMLTFKGTGASATNTPTDEHHRKIKGKHLIVMSNNIGYDVSHNQFDLMIPGGGPGAFNGCGKMGISCSGAQYGGFLTTCDYDKNCLINMCKQEYSNTSLQNGCLFLANWMDAANNPEIDFVQVECPSALESKY